jgi:hypothetical protein
MGVREGHAIRLNTLPTNTLESADWHNYPAGETTEHAAAGEPGAVSRWGALEVTAGVLVGLA